MLFTSNIFKNLQRIFSGRLEECRCSKVHLNLKNMLVNADIISFLMDTTIDLVQQEKKDNI